MERTERATACFVGPIRSASLCRDRFYGIDRLVRDFRDRELKFETLAILFELGRGAGMEVMGQHPAHGLAHGHDRVGLLFAILVCLLSAVVRSTFRLWAWCDPASQHLGPRLLEELYHFI